MASVASPAPPEAVTIANIQRWLSGLTPGKVTDLRQQLNALQCMLPAWRVRFNAGPISDTQKLIITGITPIGEEPDRYSIHGNVLDAGSDTGARLDVNPWEGSFSATVLLRQPTAVENLVVWP